MNYAAPAPRVSELRLEAVTVCVGFDDLLDLTLQNNHPHLDTMIVVTSHDDRATQMCAQKHGATVVQTDLFKKDGRNFNKGAAINAGMSRFRFNGWRLHIDADIAFPDNFRRVLFNLTHLDESCIYGADRIDILGKDGWRTLQDQLRGNPQAIHRFLIEPQTPNGMGHRYVEALRGYVPIGYFQLWHAKSQKDYPHSLGTCQHDDVLFAEQWALQHRRLLPSVITYHLCARKPVIGENWDGERRQPRLA